MTRPTFFILLTSLALYAQSITYQELLQSATDQSDRLKLFKTDEQVETSRLETVYGQYYPNLSVSYNTEYNRDLDGFPRGTESVGDTIITSGTRFQSSLSLNLNYELYHFGTTAKSINIAKSEVDIKRLLWCEEEKRLHQNILDRYNSALKMNIQGDLKEQMLEVRYKLYKIKQRLYKAGKYSKVDLGDEAITIIDLEREIERSLMQYQEDIIVLSSLSYIELDEETTELLPIMMDRVDDVTEDFEATAEGHKYSQSIRQKQEEISMYKRSQFPTVSMYGNYYMYGSDSCDAYESFENVRKNSWKLGVAVRMSLFEGFKYNNESERLRYELQRIKQERDMYEREYQYDARVKASKITHLAVLEEKDQRLYRETREKIHMIDRLRKIQQVDSVSELNAKLEGLERELNLKIEQSEAAYEKAALAILYRGVEQCTQH